MADFYKGYFEDHYSFAHSDKKFQSGYKYKVKEDGLGKLRVVETGKGDQYDLLNRQRVERYDRKFERMLDDDEDRKKSK